MVQIEKRGQREREGEEEKYGYLPRIPSMKYMKSVLFLLIIFLKKENNRRAYS